MTIHRTLKLTVIVLLSLTSLSCLYVYAMNYDYESRAQQIRMEARRFETTSTLIHQFCNDVEDCRDSGCDIDVNRLDLLVDIVEKCVGSRLIPRDYGMLRTGRDAWGNRLMYRHDGNELFLSSVGPNGINEDGTGDDISRIVTLPEKGLSRRKGDGGAL